MIRPDGVNPRWPRPTPSGSPGSISRRGSASPWWSSATRSEASTPAGSSPTGRRSCSSTPGSTASTCPCSSCSRASSPSVGFNQGAGVVLGENLATIAYPYLLWSTLQTIVQVAIGRGSNHRASLADLPGIVVEPIMQFWFSMPVPDRPDLLRLTPLWPRADRRPGGLRRLLGEPGMAGVDPLVAAGRDEGSRDLLWPRGRGQPARGGGPDRAGPGAGPGPGRGPGVRDRDRFGRLAPSGEVPVDLAVDALRDRRLGRPGGPAGPLAMPGFRPGPGRVLPGDLRRPHDRLGRHPDRPPEGFEDSGRLGSPRGSGTSAGSSRRWPWACSVAGITPNGFSASLGATPARPG